MTEKKSEPQVEPVMNAKNTTRLNSFLLIGEAASGKTTQLLTLPGKGFVIFTDPNGPAAIGLDPKLDKGSVQGYDIDYEVFVRDVTMDEKGNPVNPQTLKALRKSLESKMKSGFFKSYDWIALDNITFLFDIVYDDFLANRGIVNPQGVREIDTLRHAMALRGELLKVLSELRQAAYGDGQSKVLVFIAHQQNKEDSYTGQITERNLSAWGQLESQIPSYVVHIFYCTRFPLGEKTAYKLVLSDPSYKRVRTLWRDAPSTFDAKIGDFSKPQEYGLGKLLKTYGG